MFTSSFFENKAGFEPDASQPFGKEFERYAKSQKIPRGTPQYDRALVKAASQEVQVTWFTTQGRLRRERILRQRELERMDNLPLEEEGNDPLDTVMENDELETNYDDHSDAESVVSIDVGPSQAFMSDDYRLPFGSSGKEDVQQDLVRRNNVQQDYPQQNKLQQNSAREKSEGQSNYRIDNVMGSSSPHKKQGTSSPHAKKEPLDFDLDDKFLSGHVDSDNESEVSMDEGLTQKYLPEEDPVAGPVAAEGELEDEEDEAPPLTKEDELLGFRTLCRETGREPGKTIRECKAILKAKPYINIIDYIDSVRLDEEVRCFDDLGEFSTYTRSTPGKRISAKEACKDRFLRCLLQRLGPIEHKHKQRGKSNMRSLPPPGMVPHSQPFSHPIRHARSRATPVLPY